MKTEDFERLKAVCEKEGFDISGNFQEAGKLFIIEKKDLWDGVDFFFSSWSGKIFRRDQIDIIDIVTHNKHLSPSTESAYIKQLKKECFERFGEIKEGDKFERYGDVSPKIQTVYLRANQEWDYIKSTDEFFYFNVQLYRQGKWATRVKERVEVKPLSVTTGVNDPRIDFSFLLNNRNFALNGASQFLASQLEKYLNGEIE